MTSAWTTSTFLASTGGLNSNDFELTPPVPQFRNRSVYCGEPVTHFVVITYFNGRFCSPLLIQSCQSTSSFRNAR